jgi:hypothetical protein
LALALGRTVGELQESLTEDELDYWLARYSMRPFGETTAWARHGQEMAFHANMHRKKTAPAYKPTDFIPDFEI